MKTPQTAEEFIAKIRQTPPEVSSPVDTEPVNPDLDEALRHLETLLSRADELIISLRKRNIMHAIQEQIQLDDAIREASLWFNGFTFVEDKNDHHLS